MQHNTLAVPGATLYYELRGHGPLVLLTGSPMDARSFTPLAELLATDHTVLTTDPRAINRSSVEDRDQDSTPQQRADDLSRLIGHVGAGPAIAFGSSGGAVSVLALAEAHPEQLTAVIAHEPPIVGLLDDAARLHAETDAMCATYLAGEVIDAWRQFMAQANLQVPDEALELMFGGERDPRSVADERFWFEHELRPTTHWMPDLAALRSTRVLVGLGEESSGQLCDRTCHRLAAELGIEPTVFPGDHTGFADQPDAFAKVLHEVLREILG
ncbi:alpha/beta fold hydrolase [Kribbella sp. CA-253562]|uniref:alpha/beta fold hydrolase n=1 Tax=Kribbella sp. CA-253562 TaxID=3239942 RepID=UPI003D9016DD